MQSLIGRLIGTAVCGFIVVVLLGSLMELAGNEVEEAGWNNEGHLVSHRTRVFLIFLVFMLACLGFFKGVVSFMTT